MVRAVTPIPFVKARFFDRCGKPLAGGKVYTYEANTTTAKTTYKDPYGLTPNTNPIILDAAGEADIYLDGTYRIRITDRNDVLVNDVSKIGSWFSDNLQDTLDNISGAMDEALKPILQNLDDVINTAAAAGAGANGWTATLIADGNQTQAQINAATPQIFNTIADLKAFADAKNKQRVIVLSRNNTTKKLGGGIFIFDAADTTTAENGGTVFIGANNGRWKRVEDTDVCVSWFAGANDNTDKSADIQKAINYANALVNAKALCVDDKYLIANTLKIDRMVDQTKGDFVIYSTGNNNGFLIKKPMTMFSSNNAAGSGSGYTRTPTCEFVTFNGLDFEAETADVNNFVIDDLFLRSTFDKCTFRKMRLVKAVDYLQTLRWHNCKFRQHVDFLIDTRDAYDVQFTKNGIENSGKGLRFTGIARACHIDENLYQGSTAPFLAAAGFFSSSCDKNYFEANNGVDIDIGINGGVSGGFTLNNNLWLLHDVSDVSFYPVKVGLANGFAMYGNTSNRNLCDNRFANPFAISEGANAARTTLAVNPKMAQSLVLGDSTNYDTATPIKTLTVRVSTATASSGLALPKLANFKNGDKITVINYSDKVIKVYPASGERGLGAPYSAGIEQTGYGKAVSYIKSDSDFWIIN